MPLCNGFDNVIFINLKQFKKRDYSKNCAFWDKFTKIL
ncbi:hypothetical protein HC081234_10590 [Helicobacter cinaedi]|nr:hypothetical protein HC081234_10590 [Helicobacter cinaedi]